MEIKRQSWMTFAIGLGLGWVVLAGLMFNKQVQRIVTERIIGMEYNTNLEFTQDSLIKELKELNVRYPHIVLAQSQIETGNFTSNIFKQNHNCFGLKEAKARATTSKGTKRGHALFDTWRESVLDYAFMQCRYMKFDKEEDYYAYLGRNYAEDPGYIVKVRKQANKNKKYFEN